ncbi:MAG: hypothetical protein ACTHNT_00035 [Actinomycetales bacterium]
MNLSRTPSARAHLGVRVSLLLDDELDADSRGIALLHVAECPSWAHDLRAERELRETLRGLSAPLLSDDLMARLLAIGTGEEAPDAVPTSLLSATTQAGILSGPSVSSDRGTRGDRNERLSPRNGRGSAAPLAPAGRPTSVAPSTRPAGGADSRPHRLRRAGRRLRHAAPVTAFAVALGAVVVAGGAARDVGGSGAAGSPAATLVTGRAAGPATSASLAAVAGQTGSRVSATQRRSAGWGSPESTVPVAQLVTAFVSVSDTYSAPVVARTRPLLEWHDRLLPQSPATRQPASSSTARPASSR